MALNMKTVELYAKDVLEQLIKDTDATVTTEVNRDNGTMTLKLSGSINICGYSALPQFMFMQNGEIYFFTLFDELELTVENAATAFEISTSTALNIAIDDYLTAQLGAYLFHEEDAGMMIERYFDDLIYLLEEDPDMKKLLSKMH